MSETTLTRADISFPARNRRRILCVFPRYSNSFGTFQHAFPLMPPVQAFMPPQGILLIAALVPKGWEVRFVDENIREAGDEEMEWADVVFLSGMHIQRDNINTINARAHAKGKLTVLGGASVSSAPEFYPDIDILQCGEVGDSTLRIFQRIDETVDRPPSQQKFQTVERLPMLEFPSPAYHFVDLDQYLLGSVQFSSGCPFTCEFCDIPALYGRNPRLKSPEQIIHELDQIANGGAVSVYFVDDNFIGNPNAAKELLPHLIAWQKKRDYQVRLSCEATLNMARYPDILKQMQEAYFTNVFFGIETPEPEALRAMRKTQNLRGDILEAVHAFNQHGIEPASGIIMGLDTDTDQTAQAILDFVELSQIPILTVNILYALPKTALYERLQKAGRINSGEGRDSNIDFLRPYETLVSEWRDVIRTIYSPENLYRRYHYQARNTYIHQVKPASPFSRVNRANLARAGRISKAMFTKVGIQSDYRRHFWKMAWQEMRRGNIENIFQIGMVAHHLITYAREAAQDNMQASNYSHRTLDEQNKGDKDDSDTIVAEAA